MPQSDPDATPTDAAVASPMVTGAAGTLPMATYEGHYSDTRGYDEKVTVMISPVVPGTDTAAVAAGWQQVGGHGTPPCRDVNPTGSATTSYILKSSTAGYAFGTLKIDNLGDEFDPPQWVYQFQGGPTGTAIGLGTANGPLCQAMSGASVLRPMWDGNTWQIPIVIAIADYLTPATPNGNTGLLGKSVKVTGPNADDAPLQITLTPYAKQ